MIRIYSPLVRNPVFYFSRKFSFVNYQMSKRVLITDFFSNKATVKSKKVKTEKKPEPKVEVKEPKVEVEVKESPVDQPTVNPTDKSSTDYDDFCKENNFNKTEWIESLTSEQRNLLQLEIDTLHITWLAYLHKELTKPYFLKLKQFLKSQSSKTIFPPSDKIYSWSHLTPLPNVKCLILGQDPYHGVNQAHGLAFSVLEPTRPPPSLINIYKTLAIDYPQFEVPDYKKLTKAGTPGGGNLTQWAERGVLMLNAVLTVEAHKANSHAGQGWEEFTEKVIEVAIDYHKKHNQGFVIMAWGSPAQKRVAKFNKQLNNDKDHFLVLRTVHPSPLSAHRGFFESKVFVKCNEWLEEHKKDKIDWGILPGNSVQ